MIDLHIHSTFSDGSQTPEQLVAQGVKIGLTALALTDHDNAAGVERFMAACRESPLRGIPGVEVSVDCDNGSMHILGYFIDPKNPNLCKLLGGIQDHRAERNREILKHLVRLGLSITMEEVASRAGGEVVGRPHFAQALRDRGYVKTFDEAFKNYLSRGKPAYVERVRQSPAEGIEMIRNAGGVAVLAHPFTLTGGRETLRRLVKGLAADGLQGIEVYYPRHTGKMMRFYTKLAKEFNLVITGGTDYHGAPMPDIMLGSGFGSLNVPDELVDQLAARRPA
ncbi:MAG: PHP domain-containing protein [Lentisphaerae bacterium]|nr:PHP domain-containing protein [Lentisphaerota bacterium]